MSFFPFDDGEEDFDEWFSCGHRAEPSIDSRSSQVPAAGATWPVEDANAAAGGSSSDDADDDDIEWEDAVDDEEDIADANAGGPVEDSKPPAFDMAKLKPVSVNLGNAAEEKEQTKDAVRTKTRKRKRILRNKSLPQNLASLLENLHQSHLLCLASASLYTSSRCSDDEILAIGGSMLPPRWGLSSESDATPSLSQLNKFLQWYFLLVRDTPARRRQRRQENAALGAPAARRRRTTRTSHIPHESLAACGPSSRLRDYCSYLAWEAQEHEHLLHMDDDEFRGDNRIQSLFLVVLVRSMGWRARVVQVLEPMKRDMDEDHPLMVACTNIFSAGTKSKQKKARRSSKKQELDDSSTTPPPITPNTPFVWAEILVVDDSSKAKNGSKHYTKRWIHVDAQARLVDTPDQVAHLLRNRQQGNTKIASVRGKRQKSAIPYVLAVEHRSATAVRLTDVTPRYTSSWAASLRARGFALNKRQGADSLRDSWWSGTLRDINNRNSQQSHRGTSKEDAIDVDDQHHKQEEEEEDVTETQELQQLATDEAIPTSKAAFQTHPLYVIPSVLGKCEVLAPDAKQRICGIFKGQIVYRRSDVSTALPAAKWPYQGRRVLQTELTTPIKQVKARKKPAPRGFKALKSYGVGTGNDGSQESTAQSIENGSAALEDGVNDLYAIWQTEPWSPPFVGPQDPIPTNEFRNIELALINPGLVHLDGKGLAKVAKQLGIPYAPCLLGFEGHAGNRTPTIRGIVVHEHNQQLMREAGVEVESNAVEIATTKHRREVLLRWKRLMVNLLTKERLEREYGRKPDEEEKDASS